MDIYKSYFDNTQITLIFTACVFFVISLIFQIKNKEYLSVTFLVFAAISIFCFAALLDPFLNLWDERFHAVVSKNMLDYPFKPMLYKNLAVNMDYNSWDKYHIWLHKQPLFLWQIALSFKLFGISEFTLRLPSIILSVIFVIIGYRSGKLLVNKNVGFLAGVFIISSIYVLELVAGRQTLDHNDLSFMVYISLSIWSFIEYKYSKKRIWIYLIGVFSGFAILCKWLVGLLIYAGWITLKLQQKELKFSQNKDLFLSLAITLLIALPWQIFIFIFYPVEAAQVYNTNAMHYIVPIEGHGGNFLYHFNMFNAIYGVIAAFLIVPSFIVLKNTCTDRKLVYSLLSMVIIIYIFFSFAATKMPSFTIVVSIIIFISFATLFDEVLKYINQIITIKWIRNLIFIVAVVFIVIFRFDIEFLQEKHTTWKKNNIYTRYLIYNREIFKSLELPDKTALFNVKGRHYIEAMFYTGFPSYNFIPSIKQIEELKAKNWNIAVFKAKNNEIPSFLINDPSVIIINKELKGFK